MSGVVSRPVLSHPADIFLPNWSRGRPASLDVTVISSIHATPHFGRGCGFPRLCSSGGGGSQDGKMAAHFEACRAVGVDFVPVAVESLGGGARRLFFGRLVGC